MVSLTAGRPVRSRTSTLVMWSCQVLSKLMKQRNNELRQGSEIKAQLQLPIMQWDGQ